MFSVIAASIALIATWVAYTTNRATIGMIAAVGWLLLSFAGYQNSLMQWDAWYVLAIASFFITLAILYEVGSSMKIWTGRQSNEKPEIQEQSVKVGEIKDKTTPRQTIDDRRKRLGLPPKEKRFKW
jgi:hypothetical protein